MAVAFLPVFYSKHALNDVVTLAPVTVALVGCLLVYERGWWTDWALAGGAIGVATATKYTAGAMLLTLLVAAGLRVHRDRAELRNALLGLALAGAACFLLFAVLNPFALLNPSEARGQISGQSAQADTAKLGQDDTYGWIYYLGTLHLGLRLAAAARRGRRRRARPPARLAPRAAARRVPRLLLPLHGRAGPLLRPLADADLPVALRARRLRAVCSSARGGSPCSPA